jgi:type II secretory ATPase GspE/PulE/Tfp pilus assembly ATPase PilB-like protein
VAGVNLKTGATALGRKQRAAVVELIGTRGLAGPAAVGRAELVAARTGQPLEQVLNQLGELSDDDLVATYAEVASCEVWDPDRQPVIDDLGGLGVSSDYLRRARIAPLAAPKGALICAACDPLDDEALSGLVFATGRKISVLAARPADWRRAFDAAFSSGPVAASPDARRLEREIELVSDSSADGAGARLVASAFEAAIAARASDIHLEPHRHELVIRLRIDGRLVDHARASADLAQPAVSRVKVIANLDLGEKRLPQDGRTTFVIGGRQVDVRVATSPTVFGESAVLRILDRASVPLDLAALGMSPAVSDLLMHAVKAPHGLFLVTGPTGSGKTTTLYALLQTFAGSGKKVLSVEDPVEYHFDHVSQTQVAPHVGLTFAAALRSFLRQDPDVILVGEIRDPETAAVAVQAAMTGHFVLASVHANDALAVVPRLHDMGVEPYQLAAGFRGAAAQRLVRRLCPACATRRPPSAAEAELFVSAGLPSPPEVSAAAGCPECRDLGYRGRLAIAETFLADEPALRAIAARDGVLADLVRRRAFTPMLADGLAKAAEGLTSVDEVAVAVHG